MATELDIEKLSQLVRTTRGSRGLRATSKEIGYISTSTLSRIENGATPDIETFLSLCDWLKASPADFFKTPHSKAEPNTPEALVLAVKADKRLEPAIANVLAALIKAAYRDLSQSTDRDRDY